MKNKTLLVHKYIFCTVICSMFLSQNIHARNKIYYYEPKLSEVVGITVNKVVKGHCDKDNYEGDKNIKEICPFLILDEPIDVVISKKYSKIPADPIRDKPEKNVKILQISNTGQGNYTFKTGKRVKVSGVLFRHFANCHHTRVLIDYDNVNKIGY